MKKRRSIEIRKGDKFRFKQLGQIMQSIDTLLQATIDRKASDLHIISDYFPSVRINSELVPLKTLEMVTAIDAQTMLFNILTEEQKQNLLANKEIDFGYEYKGNRFRANIYYAKNRLAGAFRFIPAEIRKLEELKLPNSLYDFTRFEQGLVLMTGPTGEGKSTTLATMINDINMRDAKHIVTIEDPIEFVYPTGRSIISQRELHQDTHSWTVALRSVLREDPDVVLIGEMRDLDTIQAAITVAETGHLVFATLHTSSTPEAVNRMIDVFPSGQQNQIRNQLASVLKVIITQRLVPTIDKKSRIPALEVLVNIPAVAAIIREGKLFLLDNVLETEEKQGMILFEKYLYKLYQQGVISKEDAIQHAVRTSEIKKFII
ncbi:MAG: PilT/PilU family type 4a pilus ATPase [Patescibacteria group bacterium]